MDKKFTVLDTQHFRRKICTDKLSLRICTSLEINGENLQGVHNRDGHAALRADQM